MYNVNKRNKNLYINNSVYFLKYFISRCNKKNILSKLDCIQFTRKIIH